MFDCPAISAWTVAHVASERLVRMTTTACPLLVHVTPPSLPPVPQLEVAGAMAANSDATLKVVFATVPLTEPDPPDPLLAEPPHAAMPAAPTMPTTTKRRIAKRQVRMDDTPSSQRVLRRILIHSIHTCLTLTRARSVAGSPRPRLSPPG